jgi:hypothetical protein
MTNNARFSLRVACGRNEIYACVNAIVNHSCFVHSLFLLHIRIVSCLDFSQNNLPTGLIIYKVTKSWSIKHAEFQLNACLFQGFIYVR